MTTYIIVLSGKGGVGKTTTAVNLGLAFRHFDRDVVVVDTNLITPNVALQLGFPPSLTTLNNVLKKKASIEDAVWTHESGLDIIPAGISMKDSGNHILMDFKDALAPLAKDYEIVIMDCGSGLWGNILKIAKAADEVLIVTNPELPALVDSLKSIKMVEKLGIKIRGIVLSKTKQSKHELKDNTIEGMLNGYSILGKIPFDKNVPKSVALKKPIVAHKPRSPASRAYKKLAARLLGEDYEQGLAEKVFSLVS